MKRLMSGNCRKAFNVFELLLVIAIVCILILAALMYPWLRPGPRRATSVVCMNNLRQVSVGMLLWESDHTGHLPWQLSTNSGGTLELIPDGTTFPHVRVISPYLLNPNVLLCPTDEHRMAGTNVAQLLDRNLSYFLNVDVNTNSRTYSILSGDRHLEVDGKAIRPGLVDVWTNRMIGWTRELHGNPTSNRGNLGFADGHMESVSRSLNPVFSRQELEHFRLVIP